MHRFKSNVVNSTNKVLNSSICSFSVSDVSRPFGRSDKRPAILDTCQVIINLEKKMITRFDGLEKELLNITDVIIKDLQIESQLLHFFL